jgi:hypothetical protein
LSASLQECTPLCKKFRCDRKPAALKIVRKSGKKTIWCTEIDDVCDGPWCKFGICTQRKMTDSGMCKDTPSRSEPEPKYVTHLADQDYDMDEGVPKKYARELRGAS